MSSKRKADSHLKAFSGPAVMRSRGFQSEAERDSGFSDASSEHMSTMDTTDSEDSPCPGMQHGAQTPTSGSQSSKVRPQTPQMAVMGGSYSGLSPMIIMNNVLLKQPGDSPPALKPWGLELVQPVVQQPQVVFIQPVVSRQASRASKDSSSRHRRSKKYLPILKSYPKIAPHPGDSSSSSGRGTASSSSSLSGSERSSQQDHGQKDKQQSRLSVNNSSTLPVTPSTVSPLLQNHLSLPATETTTTSIGSELSMDSLLTTPSELTSSVSFNTNNQALCQLSAPSEDDSSEFNGESDADTRRKRFCNTYNILSKSGLLDITLRTKELLRQNRRTQTDIERLKEQTELFLQALSSGDNSMCLKLQANLQEEERERAALVEVKTD